MEHKDTIHLSDRTDKYRGFNYNQWGKVHIILWCHVCPSTCFKDVRGWQLLTIEAAETLCMVCLPAEKHIFRKKYLGSRPFKTSHFMRVDHHNCIFTDLLITVK